MMTILISAYAVNPFKGSEDGMGWNYILQAAQHHQVIAVTRRNNRGHIERYMQQTLPGKQAIYARIRFLYFDWPQWTLFWKKGSLLSMIYYYCWQLSLACWLRYKKTDADLVHNLNFHNDWTPSFLWLLRKPFAWGPVGHHPRIPSGYLKAYGPAARFKDNALWLLKKAFWTSDPFLRHCRNKANMIWSMHAGSLQQLRLSDGYLLSPSVAAAAVPLPTGDKEEPFTVLSVGRFVPLKGFDITLRAFACFYKELPAVQQAATRLILVGKGKYKRLLERIAEAEGIAHAVRIMDWMTEEELRRVYRKASVFLYPSHEGAGMVVAEAMRYRLPVLCWDNYGPGTIVHPGSRLKVGYSSYAESIVQFARLLAELAQRGDLYREEAALAGQRFEEHLDWDRKAEQLREFYQETINRYQASKHHEKEAYCSSSAQ